MFLRLGQFVCLVTVVLFHSASGYNLAVTCTGSSVEFANLNTDGNEVIGIAVLCGRLYAVCVSNETVYVFEDHTPYTRLETFTVPGMLPGDLTADEQRKRLYAIAWLPANEGGSRVWEIDPSTHSYVYYVNATHWTGTLSVTRDDKICGVSGDPRINMYDSTSGLTSLLLPATIVDPQHAIQTKYGTFYVSQGWKTGQPHRISKLDSSASTILNQFGSSLPGNGTLDLNWPHHLAIDRKNVYVYAADYWNRRVLKLNSLLTLHQTILSAADSPYVGWPQRLLYHPKRSCLYTAMAEQSMN